MVLLLPSCDKWSYLVCDKEEKGVVAATEVEQAGLPRGNDVLLHSINLVQVKIPCMGSSLGNATLTSYLSTDQSTVVLFRLSLKSTHLKFELRKEIPNHTSL